MNKFIVKYFPSLGILALFAGLLALIIGFNFLMANLMESDDIVYSGQCSIDYNDASRYSVNMICGEYIKSYESTSSVDILKNYVLVQKTPICVVTMGSFTESTDFVCGYKVPSADTE